MRFPLFLKAKCKTRSNFLKKKTLQVGNIHISSKILLSILFIRNLIKSTLVYYRWPSNLLIVWIGIDFTATEFFFNADRLCTDLYVEFTAYELNYN